MVPEDLPRIIFYQDQNGPMGYAFPLREEAQAVPRGATHWRRSSGPWRPVGELPPHWLPWLNRERLERPRATRSDPQKWEDVYHEAVRRGWTFRQAMYFYRQRHNHWPGDSWPLMPLDRKDQYRLVESVPYERLVPKTEEIKA